METRLLIVERSITMIAEPSLAVTLSAELFALLNAEARKLGLPLEWLVASLVVDTVETDRPMPRLAYA